MSSVYSAHTHHLVALLLAIVGRALWFGRIIGQNMSEPFLSNPIQEALTHFIAI